MLKWGVLGVAASMLGGRVLDFLVRLFPTMKRILAWGRAHVRPEGLPNRMMTFAWQSVTSMIVALIVWDRSEFVLLKYLTPDIRQVYFYSVAFSLAERLLITSVIFGSAAGATIFAQYGRDKSKLPAITASSFRYLALTSIPVHFIAASLAVPTLILLYGNQYKGAALVVTLAPLLCLPKAFIGPVQNLLESMERQSYVIISTVIAGVVDMTVAWIIIPSRGAVGACIGSGAAQILAIGTMWAIGIRIYKVRLPWAQVAKITLISVVASLAALCFAIRLSPVLAIPFGGTASLIVLFGMLRQLKVLQPEDSYRFATLIRILPKPLATSVNRSLFWLISGGDLK